jgi:hypothetical protein
MYRNVPANFLFSGNIFLASLSRQCMSDKFNFGAEERVNSATWVFIYPKLLLSQLLQ